MTNNPAALRAAASALITAADMLEHNDRIFKGKWQKGSKAWSGDFIERTVADGLKRIGAARESFAVSESERRTDPTGDQALALLQDIYSRGLIDAYAGTHDRVSRFLRSIAEGAK